MTRTFEEVTELSLLSPSPPAAEMFSQCSFQAQCGTAHYLVFGHEGEENVVLAVNSSPFCFSGTQQLS